jgi:hypothetical protein
VDDDLSIPADFGHMSHKQCVSHFQTELRALIDVYRREYTLSYAETIGVLHIQAAELTAELLENQKEDDDD